MTICQIDNRVNEGQENFGLFHDKDNICSTFVLNLSLKMLPLRHLSLVKAGPAFTKDKSWYLTQIYTTFVHIYTQKQMHNYRIYLLDMQMSYLSSSQILTKATNIIFEPHSDCICLTSNLFLRHAVGRHFGFC